VVIVTFMQYVSGSVLLFSVLNILEGLIMSMLSKLVSPQLAVGTFNSGTTAASVLLVTEWA
jgi:hypothetical protein